jgi:hypothetical protein
MVAAQPTAKPEGRPPRKKEGDPVVWITPAVFRPRPQMQQFQKALDRSPSSNMLRQNLCNY